MALATQVTINIITSFIIFNKHSRFVFLLVLFYLSISISLSFNMSELPHRRDVLYKKIFSLPFDEVSFIFHYDWFALFLRRVNKTWLSFDLGNSGWKYSPYYVCCKLFLCWWLPICKGNDLICSYKVYSFTKLYICGFLW